MELHSAEKAEKARNDALRDLIVKASKVKASDLNKKFVVIKDVTDFGDLFDPRGADVLIFGIVGTDIYHLKKLEQASDPTKGELVVTTDADKKEIIWKQDHKEQQPFEAYHVLRKSKYYGTDAGQPMLEALEAHIHGTYNIAGYDSRLVTFAELVADLKENGESAPVQPAKLSAPQNPTVDPKTKSATVSTDKEK